MQPTIEYISQARYRVDRPHTLVVACSDGRLQMPIDEFLGHSMGIHEYDRLFLPGGPGALASSGSEFSRSERHMREFAFLLEAHLIEQVVLLFHGPAPDGPAFAVCADYARSLGTDSPERILESQHKDANELLRDISRFREIEFAVLWAEVRADNSVQFVNYATLES